MKIRNGRIRCGGCASRCPHGLKTDGLVAVDVAGYENFIETNMREQGLPNLL
ncbi:MAG: hypothetical protein LBR82_08405 [Desulfovibrio sp.]|nr:hypothetical protein [Desulfovibrio sp.]